MAAVIADISALLSCNVLLIFIILGEMSE